MGSDCPHSTITVDHREDAYVCIRCGLVMTEKPSLCIETYPGLKLYSDLSPATLECLASMASRLGVDPGLAMTRARDMGITCRHKPALAALLLVPHQGDTLRVSLREAGEALDMDTKYLRRAVSRLRRKYNLGRT